MFDAAHRPATHAQAVEQHNRFGQSSGMEGGGHRKKK
jgi:hypothetical protein